MTTEEEIKRLRTLLEAMLAASAAIFDEIDLDVDETTLRVKVVSPQGERVVAERSIGEIMREAAELLGVPSVS